MSDATATGAPAALHAPRVCRDCGDPVFWCQVLDVRGRRVRSYDGKRWKAIPVDAQPDPAGAVVLFHRDGEGIVARILRPGETPPEGAKLRRPHWPRCRKNTRSR